MTALKKTLSTAVCIALCVVLPMIFHAIPNGGVLFSPMHLPVLLCGIITSWPFGLLCGLAGPLLSFLFTGMPGAPMLPQMMVELGCYGFMSGLLISLIKTKSTVFNVYASLIGGMLFGRVVEDVDLCTRLILASSLDLKLFRVMLSCNNHAACTYSYNLFRASQSRLH